MEQKRQERVTWVEIGKIERQIMYIILANEVAYLMVVQWETTVSFLKKGIFSKDRHGYWMVNGLRRCGETITTV